MIDTPCPSPTDDNCVDETDGEIEKKLFNSFVILLYVTAFMLTHPHRTSQVIQTTFCQVTVKMVKMVMVKMVKMVMVKMVKMVRDVLCHVCVCAMVCMCGQVCMLACMYMSCVYSTCIVLQYTYVLLLLVYR